MIEKQIRKDLHWHSRSKIEPESPDTRVAQLFCVSTKEIIGYVCNTSRGYLWFITTQSIPSRHSFEALTQEQAEAAMFEYVVHQMVGVVNSIMPLSTEGVEISISDKSAAKKYSKKYGRHSFTMAFACGMDYMLKAVGISRPPAWVKYTAQDFDGVWKYFEDVPILNVEQNRWYSRTGRTVRNMHPSWMHSVRRISF